MKGKELAATISASNQPSWYVGAFQFRATPRIDKNVRPEDLEKEIWAEIDKIKAEGVTADEIQKAKNRAEAMFVRSLSNNAGLARRVAVAELTRGWHSLLTDLDALQKVTSADVQRVAAKYFVKDNSLTAIYTRKMEGREGGRRGPRPGTQLGGPPSGKLDQPPSGIQEGGLQ